MSSWKGKGGGGGRGGGEGREGGIESETRKGSKVEGCEAACNWNKAS